MEEEIEGLKVGTAVLGLIVGDDDDGLDEGVMVLG